MLCAMRLLRLSAVALIAIAPAAQAELAGTWELYPEQANSYETAVQQPINTDGSSNFKFNGKSVVPVKFSLLKAKGPVEFVSIYGDVNPDNNYSYLSFTPAGEIKFEDIVHLSSVYEFLEGNCQAGSLRWQVRVRMPDDFDASNLHVLRGVSPVHGLHNRHKQPKWPQPADIRRSAL